MISSLKNAVPESNLSVMKWSVSCLLVPLLLLLCSNCVDPVNGESETEYGSLIDESDALEGITRTTSRIEALGSKPDVHFKRARHSPTTNSNRAAFPCPYAAAILPCVCTVDDTSNITVDCTEVDSEEQLAAVFQQDFPVKELYQFSMANNSAVKTLDNFLNGVTFDRVSLEPGPFVLETVSEQFLLALKDTLQYLSISYSNLTTEQFPFAVLPSMNLLETLRFYGSEFNSIPPILAPKLSLFLVNYSPVDRLLNGTISIGAESASIYFFFNQISAIEPGSITFADDDSATSREEIYISFGQNQIQSLQAMTFPFRNGETTLYLANNNITLIEPGTFVLPETTDSLRVLFFLHDNELTTLDEAVFGDVMPFTSELIAYGNPLTCGCDIAWLVLNPDFLAKVDTSTACANGTNLFDLDPESFEDLCW